MPIHTLHFFGFAFRTWVLVGQVPFLAFILALYVGGRRQGWPWRATILATAAFVAGLGVGTTFLPSVLGAVGGGIAVWFLAQRVLGLRHPPIAVLTLGLVALIAIGRWGCLLNGCCFGTVTDLPWAVQYAAGSSPHFLHQSLGLLPDGALQSLAVHPYPAYESLGLLLWLPFAHWLNRHLRSKGALLAFTAAFDLALRGFIDGTRAMINVWWSLLGLWHGLNLFQWVLLAAASCLLLLGLLFEHRARRATMSLDLENASAASTSPARLWLVYGGLWALGWASDSGQTAFLHRALLVALAACVPALTIPLGLSARLRARAGFGYAVAGALVVVLGIHLETRAHATTPDGDAANGGQRVGWAEHRTWLYDVDQKRGVMVRVGSTGDDDRSLQQREDTLGLPRLAAGAAERLAPTEPRRRSQTWIGGGVHAGSYAHSDQVKTPNNSSSDSCSGNTYTTTTTRDRQALGAWGRIEQEIPDDKDSVFWIGGRAGASREWQTNQVESTDPSVQSSSTGASYSAYYLNLWGEYETPALALGLAALGAFSREQGLTLYPGFHLRVGSPRFGFDAGFADRLSFLSQQSGHAGFSVAIRKGDEIRFPNDLRARLFFGMFFFPGNDIHRFDLAPGFGAEIFVTPKAVVGFNTAIFVDQIFAGLHLRLAVGP